jgi:hypothetical protein
MRKELKVTVAKSVEKMVDGKHFVEVFPDALKKAKEMKVRVYYARLQSTNFKEDGRVLVTDEGDAVWFHNERKEREVIARSYSELGLMHLVEQEGLEE